MKTKFYYEIEDSDKICGGIYPLGGMTEKQALKEVERRVKELWKTDKNGLYKISVNLCTDCDALDMIYNISLFKGDITIYDYRTEEFVKDTLHDRISRRLKAGKALLNQPTQSAPL